MPSYTIQVWPPDDDCDLWWIRLMYVPSSESYIYAYHNREQEADWWFENIFDALAKVNELQEAMKPDICIENQYDIMEMLRLYQYATDKIWITS